MTVLKTGNCTVEIHTHAIENENGVLGVKLGLLALLYLDKNLF